MVCASAGSWWWPDRPYCERDVSTGTWLTRWCQVCRALHRAEPVKIWRSLWRKDSQTGGYCHFPGETQPCSEHRLLCVVRAERRGWTREVFRWQNVQTLWLISRVGEGIRKMVRIWAWLIRCMVEMLVSLPSPPHPEDVSARESYAFTLGYDETEVPVGWTNGGAQC